MNIEAHYKHVESGRRALAIANKLGQPWQGRAMGLYNKARARLRHAQNGTTPPKRYDPDFTHNIQGIPCFVSITWHRPGDPSTGWPADAEFVIVNDYGYRMQFLEDKITDESRRALADKILSFLEVSK